MVRLIALPWAIPLPWIQDTCISLLRLCHGWSSKCHRLLSMYASLDYYSARTDRIHLLRVKEPLATVAAAEGFLEGARKIGAVLDI